MSKTIAQVEGDPVRVVFELSRAVSEVGRAVFALSRAIAEIGRAICGTGRAIAELAQATSTVGQPALSNLTLRQTRATIAQIRQLTILEVDWVASAHRLLQRDNRCFSTENFHFTTSLGSRIK